MIKLYERDLPDTILVNGESYLINTDYRIWLRYSKCLIDNDLDIAFVFVETLPSILDETLLIELNKFYTCEEEQDEDIPKREEYQEPVFDFEYDSDYVYSAFWQMYGIDLLTVDLHWHKFKALFSGVTDDTKLGKIIGYRSYTGKDKELLRIKSRVELPIKYTDDEKEQMREFNNLFG